MKTAQENKVPITQLHMPNGRQSSSWCEVSDAAFENYKKAEAARLRVTAEILSTGQISLCIEDHEDGDFDCRIASNGPGENSPPRVLEKMLMDFTPECFAAWKLAQSA